MHYAVYGTVKLVRITCPTCQHDTLIREGKTLCCDMKVEQQLVRGVKYEVEPRGKRLLPPKNIRERILALQGNRCPYCELHFGSLIERGRRVVILRITWDHFIPFSFSQDNPDDNWIACCQVCNGIKGNKIFDTIQEVKDYVETKKTKRLRLRKMRELRTGIQEKEIQADILSSKLSRSSISRKNAEFLQVLRELKEFLED